MKSPSQDGLAYVALLRGFESDLERVSLQNGIEIRRLKEGIDCTDDTRFAQVFDPASAWVMEYRIVSEERVGDAFDAFSNAVTAMRLTGVGAVFAGDLLRPTNVMIQGPGFGAPVYRLTNERFHDVSVLTVELAGEIASPVRPAISRFNVAYDRLTNLAFGRDSELQQAGDRLIDYWIALESLFLPDVSQELSYRIALRVAYFISVSPAERRDFFRGIRRSYGLRSALVHGGSIPGEVQEISDYTQEVLRRALFRAVRFPEAIDVSRLDDAIVTGVVTEGDNV